MFLIQNIRFRLHADVCLLSRTVGGLRNLGVASLGKGRVSIQFSMARANHYSRQLVGYLRGDGHIMLHQNPKGSTVGMFRKRVKNLIESLTGCEIEGFWIQIFRNNRPRA